MRHRIVALLAGLLVLASCSSSSGNADAGAFELRSPAFKEGQPIPDRFAYGFDNVSPPLRWADVPKGTEELALTVVDPDANNFVHWVVVSIDPATTSIDEGALPHGAVEAENQFGHPGWDGPQPPAGEPHTYVFTLYALSSSPDVTASTAGATAVERIETRAMKKAELRATYTSS